MLRSLLLLSLLLMGSCATHKSKSAAAKPETAKTMSQKFNGPAIKPNANGEWPEDMKKFSALDGDRQSAYFTKKSTIAKPYKTGEYAKTAWTGKVSEVERPTYNGHTDGSRFHTPSNIQHNAVSETHAAAVVADSYKTGDYKTSAARENLSKQLAKPTDAATEARRRVYPEPEISSWKQQRSMDMKTTKSILGREQ